MDVTHGYLGHDNNILLITCANKGIEYIAQMKYTNENMKNWTRPAILNFPHEPQGE